jgi:hypothetical protein
MLETHRSLITHAAALHELVERPMTASMLVEARRLFTLIGAQIALAVPYADQD